jgi:hypothetical protein
MADNINTNEKWKPVVGYESLYEVSDQGRVRSLYREVSYVRRDGVHFHRSYPSKIRAQGRRRGYCSVHLSKFRETRPFAVHRLVCEAFHGSPPAGKNQTAHLNGNRQDNRACNLMWATVAENLAHKHEHGTIPRGESHYKARLTERDVLEIRRRRAAGERRDKLAHQFGVTVGQIKSITARLCWRHI